MADARRLTDALLAWDVGDLRDVDGRPLGELASSSYDEVPTEVVPCPWAGPRHGLPMNRSALRQLTTCWRELVGSVRWLAGPSPTVHRAWWAATAATTAPMVHDLTTGGPVPRVLSALYKASLGFTQVLTAILLSDDGVADLELACLGDAAAFLGFLDDGRWLVGDRQVCAGPPARIGEMFRALCGDGAAEPAPEIVALGDPTWADQAAVVLALQGAAVAATYQALRRGERDGYEGSRLEGWLTRAKAPALRAVLAEPDRKPEALRRLFPRDALPELLASWLEAGPAAPAALERRLIRLAEEAR